MQKSLIALIGFLVSVAVWAKCDNVHCGFEYLGSQIGLGYTEAQFMDESAVAALKDKYCIEEYMLTFRKLNWHLYQLELAAETGNSTGVSNAVDGVTSLLLGVNVSLPSNPGYPHSLKSQWLEKIEYSMARMILSEARDVVLPHFETLLPESVLDECSEDRSMRSIKTFKRMLCLAIAIEKYHEREGCYPTSIDSLDVSEMMRKCAYGHDIEYEYYKGKWVLRCRCESWEGGLGFDEYIPVVYRQRKRLDLCFSSTFNEKRKSLYDGKLLGEDDPRVAGRVVHDCAITGVHAITFESPAAGNTRIVPLSEVKSRGVKAD